MFSSCCYTLQSPAEGGLVPLDTCFVRHRLNKLKSTDILPGDTADFSKRELFVKKKKNTMALDKPGGNAGLVCH